jgi:hypothetical protein
MLNIHTYTHIFIYYQAFQGLNWLIIFSFNIFFYNKAQQQDLTTQKKD